MPARLHPLFKDREEEAAGASIGAAVEAALASSEFLIVICSATSAKSKWVNREIAWFKTHRDPSKVLALIVGGEPGDPDNECFPKALTHLVDADGAVTDIALDTPLAADARDSGDGKRIARLKLAAAMLGTGLDELVRRDERRRTLRTRAVVAASLGLAVVMSTLTWFAVEARKEAEFQRNEADGLVEFMLTDLRSRLEPVIFAGRLAESRALLGDATALLDRMIAKDPANAEWSKDVRHKLLMSRTWLARASGQAAEGWALIRQVIAEATGQTDRANRARALMLAGDIEARQGQADAARISWTKALGILPAAAGADGERFALLMRLGRVSEAQEVTAALERRGYRHPAYLRERVV